MALHTDTPSSDVDETALDRTLGDEWFDWKGGLEKDGGDIREGRSLFLALSFAVVAIAVLAALFLWFLISPRLLLIGPWLHGITRTVVLGGLLMWVGWYGLTVASVLLETQVLVGHGPRQRLINAIVPWAVRVGKLVGVSRDRVSNSFVKVSNSVARATGRRVDSGELLLLLPRCLTGEIRREVLDLGKSYGCRISTASGGSVARLQIDRLKPRAIITMACERDLVSGIHDVAPEIPVIAIPNRRPRGPCKDTEVNLEEIREAICLCLGAAQ
ncbi:MAG: DUF116 domain-containing protein [Candidatus Eisenbacteria sp.]|nr:DUF116 domain-containing protein [Candidatus Eisenbacteria bacterium]